MDPITLSNSSRHIFQPADVVFFILCSDVLLGSNGLILKCRLAFVPKLIVLKLKLFFRRNWPPNKSSGSQFENKQSAAQNLHLAATHRFMSSWLSAAK